MASQRFDVYIEKNLPGDDSSLVTVKFPAMQSQLDRPSKSVDLSIKPKSLKMKLEIELNQNSPTFCQHRAQALARLSANRSFSDAIVNKNIYTSSQVPVDDDQLFVAKVVDNRLVCRPLSHVMIMRSDFSHLDVKEEIDPKEEVKPVSVKFAGPGSSKMQSNQQELDDALDEYKSVVYYGVDSNQAAEQRTMLFCPLIAKVKKDPDAPDMDVDVETKPPATILMDIKPKIGTLASVKQKVKDCLIKAKIVSFNEINQFIDGSLPFIDEKEILEALNEFGLLVQGNWAVKSEILIDPSAKTAGSSLTGVSTNLLIGARDYLLWLFTQDRFVNRLKYTSEVRLPDHDVLQLLNQLATFRKEDKIWELKLPTDVEFIERYPDIVQRQASLWKVKKANKLGIFIK